MMMPPFDERLILRLGVLDANTRARHQEATGFESSSRTNNERKGAASNTRANRVVIAAFVKGKKNPVPVWHGIKDSIVAMDQGGSNIVSGGR